jgi:hypothetical protein
VFGDNISIPEALKKIRKLKIIRLFT